jgi:uncharacterized protein (DUF924 family)
MKTPADVLTYWFGAPARDVDELRTKMKRWFGGGPDVDDAIRREFGPEIDLGVEGKLDAWLAEPKGWLALVVLLDQFTRNAYRGDPKTHAGDARAVELTLEALENGTLHALPIEERHFALMPLLHAEDVALQERFGSEYALFLEDVPEHLKPGFAGATEQSQKYTDVIRRFGRFPHRNALLGRPSTPEEEAFLADWQEKARPALARELGIGPKPEA